MVVFSIMCAVLFLIWIQLDSYDGL